MIVEKEEIWRNTITHIKFDYLGKVLDKFACKLQKWNIQAQVTAADRTIRKGTGAGSDFLG